MRPHTLIASVPALALAAVLGALMLPGPAMASQPASVARDSRIVVSPHRGQVIRSHHAWLRVRAPMRMRGVRGAGALLARLNGVRVGLYFQRPHRGIRRLRASISQGLRRGRNVLRVRVRRRDGSIRRAKVRFFVRPGGPLVGAGLNRRVAVGATVRLTGDMAPARHGGDRTPAFAGAAGKHGRSMPRMRWKVVRHPRRRRMRSVTGARATKKADLSSPTGLSARFKPAVPGRYTVQLTAGRGADATSDRVTVEAVPPPLVGIDTRAVSSGNPGIKIGDTFYPADADHVVQVLVLDRRTLALESNTSYANEFIGNLNLIFTHISSALKGLGKSDLVIAALSEPVDPASRQSLNDALGAIGTPEDFSPSSNFPYSAIGVPGMKRGDGYIETNSDNGLEGYLTPDQYGNYGFVPSQRVPFSYPDLLCSATSCGEGFKIRVQDEATLAPLPHDGEVYNTNGSDLTDAGFEADRMATDINDIVANHPNALVTIEAVSDHLGAGSGYRAPVGKIGGASMDRLAGAIASVGGTRNAFNLVATKDGSPDSGGHVYMLVGWAGAGEGNGAEAAAGVNGAPDAPSLAGVLRPDRQSRLRPQAVSNQGGDPDALASKVMQPPSHKWPLDGHPGAQAAIRYLGMQVGLGSNPRAQYWTADWDTAELNKKVTALTGERYPDGTGKFSKSAFEAARKELINELNEVSTVFSYMRKLAEPFDDPVKAWAAADDIADAVYAATNSPKDDTTYQWLDFTKTLLELAGPFTEHATTVIASLMDLGMWIAGATDKTGAPSYDEVNINAHKLGTQLVNQAQQTVATYQRIGNIIVSDPVKLKYFGSNGGCDPVGNEECPPELAWGQDQKAQASANYYRGIERYLYQQLMPLGYHVFQLDTSDWGMDGPSDHRVITRTSPPDIHHYWCLGSIFGAHPWYYYPAGSDASTSLLTKLDPSTQNAVYTPLVWSEIPGANTQHGEPPPAHILNRMFDPLPQGNDPNDGGLGMSPQLTMANAKHYFWEDDQDDELHRCGWDEPH